MRAGYGKKWQNGLREPVPVAKQVFDIAIGESKRKPMSKRRADCKADELEHQHLTAEQRQDIRRLGAAPSKESDEAVSTFSIAGQAIFEIVERWWDFSRT